MKKFSIPFTLHKDTLNNGLRVITVEMPYLHSLEISLFIKVGSRFETDQNNGISHLLEHMLFRGTQSTPNSQHLHEKFESLGGDINAMTTSEYSCFWLAIHPQYLAKGMSLFSEMFHSPSFADLQIEKQIILEEILNEQNDKGECINIDDLASGLLWPHTSLSLSTLGTKENLLRFSEENIRSFFDTYYTAANMVLCLSGRIKHDPVLKYAQKYFSVITPGIESKIPIQKYTQTRAKALFKKNPGSQTNVQICFRALSYLSEDYHTLLLLQRILDDGNASLLQKNIREKQGLVYDISAQISSYYDTGTLDIDFTVAPERIAKVVQEVLKIIKTLSNNLAGQKEFLRAKKRFLIEFDFAFDNIAKIADRFGWAELFHKTESLETERDKIRAITREQVFHLCKQCLMNSALNIIVVGQYTAEEKRKIKKLDEDFPIR